MMQEGSTVQVHYTGKLTDGKVFDTSHGREPLEFTLGQQQMIKGFEAAIKKMTVGEKKTVEIKAEEAYGNRDESLVAQVERKHFPQDVELQTGQQLQIGDDNEGRMIVTVKEIGDTHITLDGNHPLAGQTLIFEIEVVEAKPPQAS